MTAVAEGPIADLVYRYAQAVTRRDSAAWASCWAEDAFWELRADRRACGRAAIVALFEEVMTSLAGVVQNVLYGTVRLDDGEASGHWSISEHYRRVTGEAGLVLADYDDAYAHRNGRWLFTRRVLVPAYGGPPDLSGTFYVRKGSNQ